MSESVEPQATQETLFESPAIVRDLNARKSVGGAVSTEFWAVDKPQLEMVDQEYLKLVDTGYLHSRLMPDSYGISTVAYGHQSRLVELNPLEYKTIVRSTGAFKNAVYMNTLGAREIDPNYERAVAAAERSIGHSFEAKEFSMARMLRGLKQENHNFIKVLKAARALGYARHSEGDLRMIMAEAWQIGLGNMLEVVAIRERWDKDTFSNSKLALGNRLLTGAQNKKLAYWTSVAKLGVTYSQERISLTKLRIRQAKQAQKQVLSA